MSGCAFAAVALVQFLDCALPCFGPICSQQSWCLLFELSSILGCWGSLVLSLRRLSLLVAGLCAVVLLCSVLAPCLLRCVWFAVFWAVLFPSLGRWCLSAGFSSQVLPFFLGVWLCSAGLFFCLVCAELLLAAAGLVLCVVVLSAAPGCFPFLFAELRGDLLASVSS